LDVKGQVEGRPLAWQYEDGALVPFEIGVDVRMLVAALARTGTVSKLAWDEQKLWLVNVATPDERHLIARRVLAQPWTRGA
jgi:hypothetical protein